MSSVVEVMANLGGDASGMLSTFQQAGRASEQFSQTAEDMAKRTSDSYQKSEQSSDQHSQKTRQNNQQSGDSFGDMAIDAAAAFAVVSTAWGAMNSALDEQGQQGQFMAKMGLSPEDAKKAADVSAAVYAESWGENLGQVTDAATVVGQALGGVADEARLKELTTDALAFGDAFGVDVTESMRAAQAMVQNGLAPSIEDAFNTMAAGAQGGLNVSGDLMDTMTEYSGQFEKLGIDGQQAMGLISQGMKNGARDTDFIADAIKEFSIRAIDGSETTAAGFEKIGMNAADMQSRIAAGGPEANKALTEVLDGLRGIEDPALRSQAAVDLFGTKAEDLGDALFALDPSTAVAGMGDMSGAMDDVTQGMTDAVSPIDQLKRGFETAMGDMAAGALPVLNAMAPLGPELATTAVAIAGIVGIIKTWMGILKIATAVQIAFNIAMGANPIGLIIIGIMALIAAVILLVQNWDTVTAWVTQVWGGFVNWIIEITDGFVVWWNQLWGGFGNWVGEVWGGFINWIKELWGGFTAWVTETANAFVAWWNALWAGFGGWITGIWQGFISWIQALWSGFVAFLTVGIAAFTAAWNATWAAVGQFIQNIWNGFISFVTGAWNGFVGFIQGALNNLKSFWNSAWTAVGNTVSTAWNFILNTVRSFLNNVSSFVNSVLNNIGSFFRSVWNGIVSFISGIPGRFMAGLSALSGLAGRVGGYFSEMYSRIQSVVGNVLSFVGGIPGKILAGLGNMGSLLLGAGADLMAGLQNGITGAIANVVGAAKNAAGAVLGGIKNFFGIKSPSRVMRKMGGYLMEGWGQGIDKDAGTVVSSMLGAAGRVLKAGDVAVSTGLSGAVSLAGSAVGAVTGGMGGRELPPINITINGVNPGDEGQVKRVVGAAARELYDAIDAASWGGAYEGRA